jgi:hypothetical protein
MFTRGSRYEAIADSEWPMPDGRIVRYKRIRFLPTPSGQAGYTVLDGDRPDLAAWRIAQDPESYWRLCDANVIARPADLTATVGARILIPDPTGDAGQ